MRLRTAFLLCIILVAAHALAGPVSIDRTTATSKRLKRVELKINRAIQHAQREHAGHRTDEQKLALQLQRIERRIRSSDSSEDERSVLMARIDDLRAKLEELRTTLRDQKTAPGHDKGRRTSSPQGNGTISGKVTDAITGEPAGDCDDFEIDIFDTYRNFVDYGYVDSSGRYQVSRLPEGDYFAETWAAQECGYEDQLYYNIPCYDSDCYMGAGTRISVTAGHITSGINFALIHGGHIAGQVTDAGTGAPIADMEVDIFDSYGIWTNYGYTYTDATGAYDLVGFPTGNYFAATGCFMTIPCLYVDKLYDNIQCFQHDCSITQGARIPVITGQTTSGIDFALNEGGHIRGQIVDASTNLPLRDVYLDVYDSMGTPVQQFDSGTDTTGYYDVSGLITGPYFMTTSRQCYIGELFDNIPCPHERCTITSGTPIQVELGQTTAGINFALDPYGHVTGRVTDSVTNAPLQNVPVWFYDSKGILYGGASSDVNGFYDACHFETDSYFARTFGASGHMDELFDNIPCFDNPDLAITGGTLIPATIGETTSGIDFRLDPCVYCNDFEGRGSPYDWSYPKPAWSLSTGSLVGTPIAKKAIAIASPAFEGCSSCSIQTSMQTAGGQGNKLYVLAWYRNKENAIELVMNQGSSKWILRQRFNGIVVASAKASASIEPNVFYKIKLSYDGANLQLSINDQELIHLQPEGELFGTVGFKVKHTTGSFGSILVQ